MKKIKILEVIGSMNMGGAETFLMNVLRNINKEKFEFYFLCYGNQKFDYEEEIKKLGGKIIRIESINKSNFLDYVSINKKVIQENGIDIVHSHTYYNSMFSILAAKKSGIKKIICHSHTTMSEPNPNVLKRFYYFISKRIINKYSNVFLACGEDAGKSLFYSKNHFTIIDNGIILENFYYKENNRQEIEKALRINSKTTVIGHVGRFEKVKNHSFILDVFFEYKKINNNSKLLLIGDGLLKKEIEKKAVKMNLQKEILFLGKRNDVNKLYSRMDALLFPSLYEGLPLTLIEAQTNGLPILASDTIDKDVDISKKIVFYPLSKGEKMWAEKLNSIVNTRYDVNKIIENSVYNMKNNIYKLECIYEMVE